MKYIVYNESAPHTLHTVMVYSFIWPILVRWRAKEKKKANSSRKGSKLQRRKRSLVMIKSSALRLSVIFKRIVERVVDA